MKELGHLLTPELNPGEVTWDPHDGLVCLVIQSCPILCDPMDCSHTRGYGDCPGKNTRVS